LASALAQRVAIAVPAALLALGIAYSSAQSPLATAAGLAAVLLAVAIVSQPLALLLLLVAALPWEGLLGFPTETVTVAKLLGLLVFVSVAISVVSGERRLRAPSTGVAVTILALAVGISLTLSPDPAAGVAKTLSYLLFIAFFFAVVQLVDDRRDLVRILRVITLSVTAAGCWGLAAFLSGEEARAAGPIEDPNDFGYLMAATLPMALYLAVGRTPDRWLWRACVPILLAAMLATFSRGVLVALAAAAVWAIATRRIRLGGLAATGAAIVAVLAAGLLLFGSLIGERVEQKESIASENVSSRQALWRGAVAMTADRPLVGVGPGRFGVESVDYVRDDPIALRDPVVHNSYLEILAETGPVALAAFVAFIAGTWLSLSRLGRGRRAAGDVDGRKLVTALQASLLIAIVGALFLSQQLAAPFWLVGALAGAAPWALAGAADRPAGRASPAGAGRRAEPGPAIG